ncbi:MAG TPA: restriction endonuclease subunit S [Bacteroidales bacterium]|nr:restriction endonuclease subunit S [Bacteroidales bacterium]
MKFEKLKNIVEVKKGKKPSFVDTPDANSVRVLQIDDLRNDTNPKFTNDKTGVFAKEDDVLIAWDGANAGTIGYGKSGYIGSTIALLRKKQPDLYSTTFIGIFLQSQYQYLRSKTTGATIPHISRKALDELEVPVISVNDQLHIANLLSKAENLIAQRKESIRLLDEFLKSTFLEMFGELKGEKVSLSSACIVNPKKSEISSIDKGIEVSFIPMAFVSEKGEVDLSQSRRLEEVWNGFTYFRENDVAFAKITPCMENGKGAIMKNLKNKIGFGTTEFHVLRPTEGLSTSDWLYHLTMQQSFRKKAELNMKGSAGQKRVPSDFFEKYKVIVPPLSLQTQFAQIVEKTEALKAQYQQSLLELENLYGSLSQKAFKGELSIKNHANL